jgi:hypothetical protein
MDNELIKSKAEEINRLHKEVDTRFRSVVSEIRDRVIRIGELLTECKKEVGHGQWMSWVETNCEFSHRTANNYINAYERRNDPNSQLVANLKDIYYPQLEHKVPPLPKEEDFPEDKPEPKEKPEPLPLKYQPYVKEKVNPLPEESDEEEIKEPEITTQTELMQEIDSLFQRLDRDRKMQVIKDLFQKLDYEQRHEMVDWVFAQGRPVRKAA